MASSADAGAGKRHQRGLFLSASAGDIEQQELLRKSYLSERDRHRVASPARTHSSAYFASAPLSRHGNRGRRPDGEGNYAHRAHISRSLSASAASPRPSAASAARKERYESRLAPPGASHLDRGSVHRRHSSKRDKGDRKRSSGEDRTFNFVNYRKDHSATNSSSSEKVHDREPIPFRHYFSSRNAETTSEGRGRRGIYQPLPPKKADGERHSTSPCSSRHSPRLKNYFQRHSPKTANTRDYEEDAKAPAGRRGSCVSEDDFQKRCSSRHRSIRPGSRSRDDSNRNSRKRSIRRSGSNCKRGSRSRYRSTSSSSRWSYRRHGDGSRRDSSIRHASKRQGWHNKYGISSGRCGSRSSYNQSPLRVEEAIQRHFSRRQRRAGPKVDEHVAAARADAQGIASEGGKILFVGGGRSGGTHRDTVLPTVAVKASSKERSASLSHVSADASPSHTRRHWRNSFSPFRRGSYTAQGKQSASPARAPSDIAGKYPPARTQVERVLDAEHQRRLSAAPDNCSQAYSTSNRETEAVAGKARKSSALLEAAAALLRQQPSQPEEQRKNRWRRSRSSSPSWKKQSADCTAFSRRVDARDGPSAKPAEQLHAKQCRRTGSTSPRSKREVGPCRVHSPFSFLFKKRKELPPLCAISGRSEDCFRCNREPACRADSLSPAQEPQSPSRHLLTDNVKVSLPEEFTGPGATSADMPSAPGTSTLPRFCYPTDLAGGRSSSKSHGRLPFFPQKDSAVPCCFSQNGRTVEKRQRYNSSQEGFCCTAPGDIPPPLLPCATAAGSDCTWRHQVPLQKQSMSTISFPYLYHSRLSNCPATEKSPNGTARMEGREQRRLAPHVTSSSGSSSICGDGLLHRPPPHQSLHVHSSPRLDFSLTRKHGSTGAVPFTLFERCGPASLDPAVAAAERRKSAAAAAAIATPSARPTYSGSSSWCVSRGEKLEHDLPYLARQSPPFSPSRYARDCSMTATAKDYEAVLQNRSRLERVEKATPRSSLLGDSGTAPEGASAWRSKNDSFQKDCCSSSQCPSAAVVAKDSRGKHFGHFMLPIQRMNTACAALGKTSHYSGDAGPLTVKGSRDSSRAAFFQAVAAAEHSVAAASCAAADTQRILRCERAAATAAAAVSARRQRLLQEKEEEHARRFPTSDRNFSNRRPWAEGHSSRWSLHPDLSASTTVQSVFCSSANVASTTTSRQHTLQKMKPGCVKILRSLSADPTAVRRNAVPFDLAWHSGTREWGKEDPWLPQQQRQHPFSNCYAERHLRDYICSADPRARSGPCAARVDRGPSAGRCQHCPLDSTRAPPAAPAINNELSSVFACESASPKVSDASENNPRYSRPDSAVARPFGRFQFFHSLPGNSRQRWCFSAPGCTRISAGDAGSAVENSFVRKTSTETDISSLDPGAWRCADSPAAPSDRCSSPSLSTSHIRHAPVAAELIADIAEKNMQERRQQIASQDQSEHGEDSLSSCGENGNRCTRLRRRSMVVPSIRLLHSLTSLSPLSLKRKGSLGAATSIARKLAARTQSGDLSSYDRIAYEEHLGRDDAFLCENFRGDTSLLVAPTEHPGLFSKAGSRQDCCCNSKLNTQRSHCGQEDIQTPEKTRDIFRLMDRLKGVQLPMSRENTSTMRLHRLKHHHQVGSPTAYAHSTRFCITNAATSRAISRRIKDARFHFNNRKFHATASRTPVEQAEVRMHPKAAMFSKKGKAEEQTTLASEKSTRVERQPIATVSAAACVDRPLENVASLGADENSLSDAAPAEPPQRKYERIAQRTAGHNKNGGTSTAEDVEPANNNFMRASFAAVVSVRASEMGFKFSEKAEICETAVAAERAASVVLTTAEHSAESSAMADFASACRRLTSEDIHVSTLLKPEPAEAKYSVSEPSMSPASVVTHPAAEVFTSNDNSPVDVAGSAVAASQSSDRTALESIQLDKCRRMFQLLRLLCSIAGGPRDTATATASSFSGNKKTGTLLSRVVFKVLQRPRTTNQERQTLLRQLTEQQRTAQLRRKTQHHCWDVEEHQETHENHAEQKQHDQPGSIYDFHRLMQHLRNFQTVLKRDSLHSSVTNTTAGASPVEIHYDNDLICIHLSRDLLHLSPAALECRLHSLQQAYFGNRKLSPQSCQSERQMKQQLARRMSIDPQQLQLRPYRLRRWKATRRQKLHRPKSTLQACKHEQLVQPWQARILRQRPVERQRMLQTNILRKKPLIPVPREVHKTVRRQEEKRITTAIDAMVLQQQKRGFFCTGMGLHPMQQQEGECPAESALYGQKKECEIRSCTGLQQQETDGDSKQGGNVQQKREKQKADLVIRQQRQFHRKRGDGFGVWVPDCLQQCHCTRGASPVKALKKPRPPSVGQQLVRLQPFLATNRTFASTAYIKPGKPAPTSAAAAPPSLKSSSSIPPSSLSSIPSFSSLTFSSSPAAFASLTLSSTAPIIETLSSASTLTAQAARGAGAAISTCSSLAVAAPPTSTKRRPQLLQLSLSGALYTKEIPLLAVAAREANKTRGAQTTAAPGTIAAATAAGAALSSKSDSAASAPETAGDRTAGRRTKEHTSSFSPGFTPSPASLASASTSQFPTSNSGSAAVGSECSDCEIHRPAVTIQLYNSAGVPTFSVGMFVALGAAPAAQHVPSPSKRILRDAAANNAANPSNSSLANTAGTTTCAENWQATVQQPEIFSSRHVTSADLDSSEADLNKDTVALAKLALLAVPCGRVDDDGVSEGAKMPAVLVFTLSSENKERAADRSPSANTASARDAFLVESLYSLGKKDTGAVAAALKTEFASVAAPCMSSTRIATSSSSALSLDPDAAAGGSSFIADQIGEAPAATSVPGPVSASQGPLYTSGAGTVVFTAAQGLSSVCGRDLSPENSDCSHLTTEMQQQGPQQLTSTLIDKPVPAIATEVVPSCPQANSLFSKDTTVKRTDTSPAQHPRAGVCASAVSTVRAAMPTSVESKKQSNRAAFPPDSPASYAHTPLWDTTRHGRRRSLNRDSQCRYPQHARSRLLLARRLGRATLYRRKRESSVYYHGPKNRGIKTDECSDNHRSCRRCSADRGSANSTSRSQSSKPDTSSSSHGESTSSSSAGKRVSSSDEVEDANKRSAHNCNSCPPAKGAERSVMGMRCSQSRNGSYCSSSGTRKQCLLAHLSHSESSPTARRQCRDSTRRNERSSREWDIITKGRSYDRSDHSGSCDSQESRIKHLKQPRFVFSCSRSIAGLQLKRRSIKGASRKLLPEKRGTATFYTRGLTQPSAADRVLSSCSSTGIAEETLLHSQQLSPTDVKYVGAALGGRTDHPNEVAGAALTLQGHFCLAEKTRKNQLTTKMRSCANCRTVSGVAENSTGGALQCSSLQSAVAAAAAASDSVGDILRAINEIRSDSFRVHQQKTTRKSSRMSSSRTTRFERSTDVICSTSPRETNTNHFRRSCDGEFTNHRRRARRKGVKRSSRDGRRGRSPRNKEGAKHHQARRSSFSLNTIGPRRQKKEDQQHGQQQSRRFSVLPETKEGDMEPEEQEEQLFITNAEDLWLLQQTNGETFAQVERLFALAAAEEEAENDEGHWAVKLKNGFPASTGIAPFHGTSCCNSKKTCCCCVHPEHFPPAVTASGSSSSLKFFLPAPACDYSESPSSLPLSSSAAPGGAASFSSALTFIDINVHSSELIGGSSSRFVEAAADASTRRLLLSQDSLPQQEGCGGLQRQQAIGSQLVEGQQQKTHHGLRARTQSQDGQQQEEYMCRQQQADSGKLWNTDKNQAQVRRTHQAAAEFLSNRPQAQQHPELVSEELQGQHEEAQQTKHIDAKREQQHQWRVDQQLCFPQEEGKNQKRQLLSDGHKHQHQKSVQHSGSVEAQREHQQQCTQTQTRCLSQIQKQEQQTSRGQGYKHWTLKKKPSQYAAKILKECAAAAAAAAASQHLLILPQSEKREKATSVEAPASCWQRMEQHCTEESHEKRTNHQIMSVQEQPFQKEMAEKQQSTASAEASVKVVEMTAQVQEQASPLLIEERKTQDGLDVSEGAKESIKTSKQKKAAPQSDTPCDAAEKSEATRKTVSVRSGCSQCEFSSSPAAAGRVAPSSRTAKTYNDAEIQHQQGERNSGEQQRKLQQQPLPRQKSQNQRRKSPRQTQRAAGPEQNKQEADQLALPARTGFRQPDNRLYLRPREAAPRQSPSRRGTHTERDELKKASTAFNANLETTRSSIKPLATHIITGRTMASEGLAAATQEWLASLTPVLPSPPSPIVQQVHEEDVANVSAVLFGQTLEGSAAARMLQRQRQTAHQQQPEQQKKQRLHSCYLASPVPPLQGSPAESEFTFGCSQLQELQAGDVAATSQVQEAAPPAAGARPITCGPALCESVSSTTRICNAAERHAPVATTTEHGRTAAAHRLTLESLCSRARKDIAEANSIATTHETEAEPAPEFGGKIRSSVVEGTMRAGSPLPARLPQKDGCSQSTTCLDAKCSSSSLRYSSASEQGTRLRRKQRSSSFWPQISTGSSALDPQDQHHLAKYPTAAAVLPTCLTSATDCLRATAVIQTPREERDSLAPREPSAKAVRAASTFSRRAAKESVRGETHETLAVWGEKDVTSAHNQTDTTERPAEGNSMIGRTHRTPSIRKDETPTTAARYVPVFGETAFRKSNLFDFSVKNSCRSRSDSNSNRKKIDNAETHPGVCVISTTEHTNFCHNHETEKTLRSPSLSGSEKDESKSSKQRRCTDAHSINENTSVSRRSLEEGALSANVRCVDTAVTCHATVLAPKETFCFQFDELESAKSRYFSPRERRDIALESTSHADTEETRSTGVVQKRLPNVVAAAGAQAEKSEEHYIATPRKYGSPEITNYKKPSRREDSTTGNPRAARLLQKTPRRGTEEAAHSCNNSSHAGASNNSTSNSKSSNGGGNNTGSSKSRTRKDQMMSEEDKTIRHVLAAWRRCPLRSKMVRFCSGGCAWETAAATRTPPDVFPIKATRTLHGQYSSTVKGPADSSDSVVECQCPTRACSIQTEDLQHMALTNITALFPDMRIKEIYTAIPQRPAAPVVEKKKRLCAPADVPSTFSLRVKSVGTNSPERSGSLKPRGNVYIRSRTLISPCTNPCTTQKGDSDGTKPFPPSPLHGSLKENGNGDNNSNSSGCGNNTREQSHTGDCVGACSAYCHTCRTSNTHINRRCCRNCTNRCRDCNEACKYRCSRINCCGRQARVPTNTEQRRGSCERKTQCCSTGSRSSISSTGESRRTAKETERKGRNAFMSCSPSYSTDDANLSSTPKTRVVCALLNTAMPLNKCKGHLAAFSKLHKTSRYNSSSTGPVDSSGRRICRPPISATDTLQSTFCLFQGQREQPIPPVEQTHGMQQSLSQETKSSTQSPCLEMQQPSSQTKECRLPQQVHKQQRVLEDFPSLSLKLGHNRQQQQQFQQVLAQTLHPTRRTPTTELQQRQQQALQHQRLEQLPHSTQHTKQYILHTADGQQQRPQQWQATLELQRHRQQNGELQHSYQQPVQGKQTYQQQSLQQATLQERQQQLTQQKTSQQQPTLQQQPPYNQQQHSSQPPLQHEYHTRQQQLHLQHSVQQQHYQKAHQPQQELFPHDHYHQQQQPQQHHLVQQHQYQPSSGWLEHHQQQESLQQCLQWQSHGNVHHKGQPQQPPALQQYRQQHSKVNPCPQALAQQLWQHHKQRLVQEHQYPEQPMQQPQFWQFPIKKHHYQKQQHSHHRRQSSSPRLITGNESRDGDNACDGLEHSISTLPPSQGHPGLYSCSKGQLHPHITRVARCAVTVVEDCKPGPRERLRRMVDAQIHIGQAGRQSWMPTAAVISSETDVPSCPLRSTPAAPLQRGKASGISYIADALVGPSCSLQGGNNKWSTLYDGRE